MIRPIMMSYKIKQKVVSLTLIVLALIFTCSPFLSAVASTAKPHYIIDRPNKDKGPTRVSVFIWMLDIDSIDSAKQTFAANVFISLKWKDPRLAGGSGTMIYPVSEVWTPRIQIANESGIVRRTMPETVTVQPDGIVYYRQRFVGPFSQPLSLKDFPFDKHLFQLQFVSSGGYKPSEVVFVPSETWQHDGLKFAAGIADNISLPDWVVIDYDAKTQNYSILPNLENPGYVFEFTAERAVKYYMLKVILPLILIVMMSWSVFWIDPENAGTQIGVATTSMLTLIAYRFAIDTQVPRVPYATRLDEFIFVSTILVFLSLIEVTITSLLAYNKNVRTARKMDIVSRLVFPAIFVAALYFTIFT